MLSLLLYTDGKEISFYNATYSSFYVYVNGYIGFGEPISVRQPTLNNHFNAFRISALLCDLALWGSGSVWWQGYADGLVITWSNVPMWQYGGSNTF